MTAASSNGSLKTRLRAFLLQARKGNSAKVKAMEDVYSKLEAVAFTNEQLIAGLTAGAAEATGINGAYDTAGIAGTSGISNVAVKADVAKASGANGTTGGSMTGSSEPGVCGANRSASYTSKQAETPKVSVIVPVFNTAVYLHRCLDSLRAQTLREIEIVCVDDGSKDESLAILYDYARIDERIKVISIDYAGVSVARNVALENATAPYIMSCDSDDWFDPEMCQKMYQVITKHNTDVAICGFNIIFEISNELKQGVEEYLRLKYDGYQFTNWKQIILTDVSLCNKIFKRKIIDEREIRFPAGLLFEDAYFSDAYMTSTRTAYYLNEPLYNYLRHEKSIMSTSYKKIGTAADYLEIAFRTFAHLKRFELFDRYRDYFWNRFIQYYSFARDNLHGEERQEVVKRAVTFINSHQNDLEGVRKDIKMRINSYAKDHGKVLNFLVRLRALIYRNSSPLKRAKSSVDDIVYTLEVQQKEIARLTSNDEPPSGI